MEAHYNQWSLAEKTLANSYPLYFVAIGLDCMAIGTCFRNECQCEKSTETLERLVQIYNTEAIISDMVCRTRTSQLEGLIVDDRKMALTYAFAYP